MHNEWRDRESKAAFMFNAEKKELEETVMRIRAITILLILWTLPSFAQGIGFGRKEEPHLGSDAISSSTFTLGHSYDVIKYTLFMDWYNVLSDESLRYYGVMQVSFLPNLVSPLDSISLDIGSPYLTVDSAFSEGELLQFRATGGMLTVRLERPYLTTDTAAVVLYYHVDSPGASSSNPQTGFYLYYGGEQLANNYVVPQTVAYTMSEPSDARYWMPCYDDPSDKALEEVTVRVPSGYTAVSNGEMLSNTDNGDGSRTFHWKENFPVATYLMCVTASVFSIVQTSYVRAPGDTIPVQYYVYPEDSSAAVSNTECNIDTVASMIRFYSSIYGEYPYEKYGMACIEPFKYGGMEHTTITTLNRNHEFFRRYVVHELAHHWWGDNVTLGTWKDIWLNEGFAVYSEALQLKHLDPQSFKDEMDYYASQYFLEYDTVKYAIYAPPPGLIFGLAEYYKAAWVLHMLKNLVGDSTYFNILSTYLSDFRFGTAVTSDFVNVASRVTHFDMSWFFDEWIYQQGYPVYSWTYRASGNSFTFYLKQEQNDAPIYKMPVDLGVYSNGEETVFSFVDSLRLQSVRFPFAASIDSILVDPGDKIIKQIGVRTDSTLPPLSGPMSIVFFPNPFNGNAQIQYSIGADSHISFDIFDLLGRKVKSLNEGYQQAGTYIIGFDGRGLASGLYLCRMDTDHGNKTTKILVIK